MKICEHCDNQRIVNGVVVTFNCAHIMLNDMKTLYLNSRPNYISHMEKLKTKEIVEKYGLDIRRRAE